MTACLSLTSQRLVCIRWTCRHFCRSLRHWYENGATVLVIEHDLDVMRNADYIIDMGPGGGEAGGRIVAVGTPEQIRENAESVTGQYL